jgi:hypothetical protein
MVLNYANGKIYKLVSDHDEQFYVGSTIPKLCQRKTQHVCKSKNPKEMGRLVYQHFDAIGWQNVRIILIETYPCNSVEELVKRQRYWYESLKPTLNSRFPQMDKQEYAGRYRQENRELCNEGQSGHSRRRWIVNIVLLCLKLPISSSTWRNFIMI